MGELFGRYVVERRLALGGMAEVCLARQMGPSGFDRVCVLKRMHPALAQLPEIVELFLHEAQLTAQLSHPNIAQVYDFGEVNGAYFMALERVEGPSLREVITWYAGLQQLVPLPLACRVVSEVASALEAAHRAKDSSGAALNLVHRDVSPSNVLVATTGVTKLIDFGIAKTRASLVQTDQGLVRGKVAYMSPEQMRGEVLDGRSDVFSLGLVFYELITGRRAIAGRTDAERFEAAVVGAMVPVETLRPGLPPSLLAVLRRALAVEKASRFEQAGQFASTLNAVISEQKWEVDSAEISALAERVRGSAETAAEVSLSECPSEAALERLARGDASPTEAEPLRRHLESCDACRRVVSLVAQTASSEGAQTVERIGRYLVESELGSGVMGLVLKAYDPQLNRPVALKLMRAHHSSLEARERLRRESQAAASVRHSNVVTVYDFGMHGDELFVAMEYVEGVTLREWAQRPGRRFEASMKVLVEVGRGVEAIHAAQLVHRDLKPENVLVDTQGHGRVADFGMVREADSDMTRPGQLLGTPAYMAPEQLVGLVATAASDQFAYCAMVFEALSGRRPFMAPSLIGLKSAIDLGVSKESWGPIPTGVRAVLRRGLAANPEARFESMTQLLNELEGASRGAGRARWVALAAVVIALVVGGAVFAVRASARAEGAAGVAASGEIGTPTSLPVMVAESAPAKENSGAGSLPVLVAGAASAKENATVTAAPVKESVAAVVDAPNAKPGPRTRTAAVTGSLHVTSTPAAEVLIDGKPQGKTPRQVKLAPGTHSVRLTLAEGGSHQASVRVEANQTAEVTWAAQQTALEIRAVPPEVEFRVAIDGKPIGSTPLPNVTLYEGSHLVAVSTEAGWSSSKRIEVRPGEKYRLKVIDQSGLELQRK